MSESIFDNRFPTQHETVLIHTEQATTSFHLQKLL